jgi:hypothetical protein
VKPESHVTARLQTATRAIAGRCLHNREGRTEAGFT